jgi:peptidoglycan hydrolase-like protein with peptidoglycan-binding domain
MKSSKAGSGGMAMGEEKVKAVQQALKDKGHDPGDVDGKMGPKTQAALRDFQKAQGLQGNGRLDDKTIQALGVDTQRTSGTSGSASPSTSTSGGSASSGGASSGSSSTGSSPSGSASGGATGSGTSGSSSTGGSSTPSASGSGSSSGEKK